MNYTQTEKLRKLAQSWNNLDSSYIDEELAETVVYESQWVLTPITGKTEVLSHLRSKFEGLKRAVKSDTTRVTAELAYCQYMQNRPCIVLTQVSKQFKRQVTLLIKIRDNKIMSIDVCFIPDPTTVTLTGEIPK